MTEILLAIAQLINAVTDWNTTPKPKKESTRKNKKQK